MCALRHDDEHGVGLDGVVADPRPSFVETADAPDADLDAFGRFQVVADRLALRTATIGVYGLDRVGFGWFVAAGAAFARVVGVDPHADHVHAFEQPGSEVAATLASLPEARIGESATALLAADVVVLALPAVGRSDAIVAAAVPGLRAGQLVVVVSDDAPAAAALFMGLARADLAPGRDVALAHASSRAGDEPTAVGADPVASVLATQFLHALRRTGGLRQPGGDARESPVEGRSRIDDALDARDDLTGLGEPALVLDEGHEPLRETAVRISVLLPCRNEAPTIGSVVRRFRAVLPTAEVYVYDNASTDDTAAAAAAAGAIVRSAPMPGKGNVLRRMFAEVDADVYVLSDGDDTYDAAAAPVLVARLRDQCLDMVVGRRVEHATSGQAYRPGHRLGNRLLTGIVQRLFGAVCQDMLSGYRVFSRRYVKSFPAFSCGFEAETEMTVHALDLSLPFDEVATQYRERPDLSTSKLRTIPDGMRISRFILRLWKEYEPLQFFGTLALLSGAVAAITVLFGGRVVSGDVALWAALASAALGAVLVATGVILDTVCRSRREMKRILYLALPYGVERAEESGAGGPARSPGPPTEPTEPNEPNEPTGSLDPAA